MLRQMTAASTSAPSRTPSIAGATTALVLLTALNLVNFIDRYILPGVQELVKADFHLSDERVGALTFWWPPASSCATSRTKG